MLIYSPHCLLISLLRKWPFLQSPGLWPVQPSLYLPHILLECTPSDMSCWVKDRGRERREREGERGRGKKREGEREQKRQIRRRLDGKLSYFLLDWERGSNSDSFILMTNMPVKTSKNFDKIDHVLFLLGLKCYEYYQNCEPTLDFEVFWNYEMQYRYPLGYTVYVAKHLRSLITAGCNSQHSLSATMYVSNVTVCLL